MFFEILNFTGILLFQYILTTDTNFLSYSLKPCYIPKIKDIVSDSTTGTYFLTWNTTQFLIFFLDKNSAKYCCADRK